MRSKCAAHEIPQIFCKTQIVLQFVVNSKLGLTQHQISQRQSMIGRMSVAISKSQSARLALASTIGLVLVKKLILSNFHIIFQSHCQSTITGWLYTKLLFSICNYCLKFGHFTLSIFCLHSVIDFNTDLCLGRSLNLQHHNRPWCKAESASQRIFTFRQEMTPQATSGPPYIA